MLTQFVSKLRKALFLAIPLFILVIASGCDEKKSTITPPADDNIIDFINGEAGYSVLAQLIEGTSLKNTLSGVTGYTLLAPTDAAFAKLPEGTLDDLSAQQKLEILRYHVIPGQIQISNNSGNETRNTLHGDPVFITAQAANAKVNNAASVTSRNHSVSNGIVHQIDEVLFPDLYGTVSDNIKKRYSLNSLYSQLEALELTDLLDDRDGHISFILPPSEIFENIEEWMNRTLTDEERGEIWKYNMAKVNLNGSGPGTQMALQSVKGDSIYFTMLNPGQYLFNRYHEVTNNPTQVLRSANGTVFYNDGLLLPDSYLGVLTLMDKRYYLSTVRTGFAKAKMTGRMYNALANQDEQFTVFIPKNGTSGLESLPEDEEELANILKYHVVIGKVTADDLQHNQTYTTWQGEEISITRNGDQIVINGTATITLADLEGTNGVVHVIDGLLIP
jgi:transforming growth factor-beta-induced protein